MLSFFEYIFYRVYDLYTRHGEKDVPVFYGIAVLTIIQTLNVLIFIQIYILKNGKFSEDLNLELWVLGIVFILNYAYFMKDNRHRRIIANYSQEFKNERKRKGFWVLVYIVSIFIFVTYTAYLIREITKASM